MNDLQREAIKEYLEDNASERLDICKNIQSYDGSMEWCSVWDLEELCQNVNDVYEFVCQITNGDVDLGSDYVRFDGYGNLESISLYDLKIESEDYIDEILEFIESNGVKNIYNTDIEGILEDEDYLYKCIHCGLAYEEKEEAEICCNGEEEE